MKNTFTPLFRGFCLSEKKWVEGQYMVTGKEHHLGVRHLIAVDEGSCIQYAGLDKYNVIPESVGIWTGLLDKNGNKIFGPVGEKGGMVVSQNGWTGPVEYRDFRFQVAFNKDKKELLQDLYQCQNVEIIGNLFETPELLKP